ncbi:hypothetical protein lb338_phage_58 [Lactobacillus phage Lb338-1]|uniref:GIY-YIG domain-containing protein n=1 Tax=Lactobacillus phage Lb338-1 TaxID=2892342 RepID=C1KFG8_9CAUD|nr:hypothetical protein lb338_phage_58 [Lactobacillus phage Lb338-1]ACO36979.1 hypothetical protein lb338_phage_58 [Lactobacillus phage Lb338-1]
MIICFHVHFYWVNSNVKKKGAHKRVLFFVDFIIKTWYAIDTNRRRHYMFKITSRFYVIHGDGKPIYVGYTNRTVKQRFVEHCKDKDFSGYDRVYVKELVDEKLSFNFTWDYEQTCSNANQVSERESYLVSKYGTQDTIYQKATGGGQTWAREKGFVKSNFNNPKFMEMTGSQVKQYLESRKKEAVWLHSFVYSMKKPEEVWLNHFVSSMREQDRVWLSTFVGHMLAVEKVWLQSFVHGMTTVEETWLKNFVGHMDTVESRWLGSFVCHMVSKEERWLSDFVNDMRPTEKNWLRNFVGNMRANKHTKNT